MYGEGGTEVPFGGCRGEAEGVLRGCPGDGGDLREEELEERETGFHGRGVSEGEKERGAVAG